MTVTQYGHHEYLINNWVDALSAGITAGSTSISVNSATGLPTIGYFRVKIGTELILCNGRSGTTLSVAARGIEGTTAAAHSLDDPISAMLTRDGLSQFLLDHRGTPFSLESSWADGHGPPAPLNRCLDDSNGVLTVSSFSWVNQGSATATDSNGGIVMTIPDEANFNLRGLVLSAPPTPWQATVRMRLGVAPGEKGSTPWNTSTHAGLWVRESSTGKLTSLSARHYQALAMWNWTNPTTYSAAVDTNLQFDEARWLWLRIEDDGTDLKGFFSYDGSNWTQDGSAWWQQSRTAFMASGPNQVGIYLNSGANSGSSGTGPAVCTVSFENFRLEAQ